MTETIKFVAGSIICTKTQKGKTKYKCEFVPFSSGEDFPKEYRKMQTLGKEFNMGDFDQMKFNGADEVIIGDKGHVIARYQKEKRRVCILDSRAEGRILYCEEEG